MSSLTHLLDIGVDVNRPYSGPDIYDPPLHTAVKHRKAAAVSLLLCRGADVNAVNRSGDTPLLLLPKTAPAVVTALLAAGADVNARDTSGRTAMMKLVAHLFGVPSSHKWYADTRAFTLEVADLLLARPELQLDAAWKGETVEQQARKWEETVVLADRTVAEVGRWCADSAVRTPAFSARTRCLDS